MLDNIAMNFSQFFQRAATVSNLASSHWSDFGNGFPMTSHDEMAVTIGGLIEVLQSMRFEIADRDLV
mgnify:CR=1